jgi:Tfp pilus assembly protein FimT
MIEIVMTLLVSLILMTMAVPQTRALVRSYRLQGAVSACTWAIQSTRYQALEQGYPYQVAFSSAAGTYQIQNETPGATSFSNVGSAVPVAGVTVTMNQDTTLQFKPNGSVSATTGALTFTLTYQGLTKTITVTTYGNVTVS